MSWPPSNRARVALWCAGLVSVTGAILVVLVMVLASQRLHDEARPPVPSTVPARAGAPGPPPGAGPGPAPAPAQVRESLEAQGAVVNATLDEVRVVGLQVLVGLVAVSLLVGWVVAGRMLRPVRRLSAAASAVSGSRLGERIHLSGPDDELKELADDFDAMLDRLEAAFARQQEFVNDASHELRTPLTVMRAEVDVALDDPDASAAELRDALTAIGEALDRTQRLTESLLRLSQAGMPGSPETHDLAAAAEQALAALDSIGVGERRIETHLEPAPVRGDPALIDRLVANLVENAAQHNTAGGLVAVTTRCEGETSVVIVENDGPLIEQGDVEALFERFRRHSAARDRESGGFGLGLAIVDAITRAHGGDLEAIARPEGGLRITVRLPGRPDSDGRTDGAAAAAPAAGDAADHLVG